jgi:hypothetical protein
LAPRRAVAGTGDFWGAQAASLYVSAACREVKNQRYSMDHAAEGCCRQAAGNDRLAADAAQPKPPAAAASDEASVSARISLYMGLA